MLKEVYGADPDTIKARSDRVKNEECPPRAGFTQNLAGSINDAPTMASTAIHACTFNRHFDILIGYSITSAADLIKVYGKRTKGEIQRLHVNLGRDLFLVLDTEIGYIQCSPGLSPAGIQCEAQSAESWPALARILTPKAIERLHAAGYEDPGRTPNYSKFYPAEKMDDAAIADELLTLLYEAYGYAGTPALKFSDENGQ